MKSMRLGVVFLLIGAGSAYAGAGESSYKRGDLEAARRIYEERLRDEPADARARYNLGNVEYRLKQLDAAQEAYRAAQSAADPNLRARAAHNLGNARLLAGDLPGAIAAYEQSLRDVPGGPDTKYNLEMALRMRETSQSQQQQSGSQDQKQDQQQQQGTGQENQAKGDKSQEDKKQEEPKGGASGEDQQQKAEQERQQEAEQDVQQDQDRSGSPENPSEDRREQSQAGEEDRDTARDPSPPVPGGYTRQEAERILDGLADEERRLLADRMRTLGTNLRVEKDW